MSSALVPLWSTEITTSDAQFLNCFTDVKTFHQREDVNYLMTMSTWLPGYWSLMIFTIHPCDTILLPRHQPSRELCMKWSYTLWHPPPHFTWPLKLLSWNPAFLPHNPLSVDLLYSAQGSGPVFGLVKISYFLQNYFLTFFTHFHSGHMNHVCIDKVDCSRWSVPSLYICNTIPFFPTLQNTSESKKKSFIRELTLNSLYFF